mgnify:CR=1 FL=1
MSEDFIIEEKSDDFYMQLALREAAKAYQAGEVPIGAVVVKDERVIARSWNQVETLKDATAHAEMLALTSAQSVVGDWRLEGCTIYVTKEPCPMCAGAIVHCRPDKVVFGVSDPKGGAAGGWINLLDSNPPLNHKCEVVRDVMKEECLSIIQQFFREARAKKKAARDTAKQECSKDCCDSEKDDSSVCLFSPFLCEHKFLDKALVIEQVTTATLRQ